MGRRRYKGQVSAVGPEGGVIISGVNIEKGSGSEVTERRKVLNSYITGRSC